MASQRSYYIVDVDAPKALTAADMEQIRTAATIGNWSKVRRMYSEYPEWAITPLGDDRNTALHIAVSMNQTTFVRKLLELLRPEEMEVRNANEDTAFCIAAISGNLDIARLLFAKNESLASITGHREMLPIELAASTGHRDMVEDMFLIMKDIVKMRKISQDLIQRLFFLAISCSLYGQATNLLEQDPKLGTTQNTEKLTALQVLARQPPTKKFSTSTKEDYRRLVTKLSKDDEGLHLDYCVKAMFDAAKSGDIEIIQLIWKNTPNLIWTMGPNGQSVLHIAVSYRRQEVIDLLLPMGSYNNHIMRSVDDKGNNILHLAAKMPPEERFGSSRPNIRMQREELWFENLEKRLPPALKIMENNDQLTPRELFFREHRELSKEAEAAVKAIAENSMVVATLITGIVFAAAITVPSKDTQVATRTAIFQKEAWYIIFILSNAVALFSSSVSLVFYLSILSSSFPEDVFIGSLQKRLMFGLAALFVSMATMVVAFTAACFLIFDPISTWVAYVVAGLGCIPVFMFLAFHHNLLTDLLPSFDWCGYLLQIPVKFIDFAIAVLQLMWISFANAREIH